MARQPVAMALTLGLLACDEGYRHVTPSTVLFTARSSTIGRWVRMKTLWASSRAVATAESSRSISSTAPCSQTRWPRRSSVHAGWRRVRDASSDNWRSTHPMTSKVNVYAADTANDVLLEIPYVVDMDPNPVIQTASHSEPIFEDTDSSGDDPSMSDITLSNGWTTTETWTVVFDGTVWKTGLPLRTAVGADQPRARSSSPTTTSCPSPSTARPVGRPLHLRDRHRHR